MTNATGQEPTMHDARLAGERPDEHDVQLAECALRVHYPLAPAGQAASCGHCQWPHPCATYTWAHDLLLAAGHSPADIDQHISYGRRKASLFRQSVHLDDPA